MLILNIESRGFIFDLCGRWAWQHKLKLQCTCVWYTVTCIPNFMSLAFITTKFSAFIETQNTSFHKTAELSLNTALKFIWYRFKLYQTYYIFKQNIVCAILLLNIKLKNYFWLLRALSVATHI